MTKEITITRQQHTQLQTTNREELIRLETNFVHSWSDDDKTVTFYKNNISSFSSRVLWGRLGQLVN